MAMLLGGLLIAINASRENQDRRGRAAETIASLYPPETSLTYKAVPSVVQPGYLAPIVDPTFGSQVTRVSDLTAMGVDLTSKKYVRNAYAKKPAWNSDGTLILLGYIYPAPLLDGKTYTYLRQISQPFHAGWSYTQPNILYGVDYYKGDLLSVDINTNTTTIVKHFEGYKNLTMGGGEGNQSDDDRWFVLIAQDVSNNFVVILYDKTNGTTVTKNFGTIEPNWTGMSHSGNYVIISWGISGATQTSGTTVWDSNLTFVRNITKSVSHGDLAYDTTGREVYVTAGDCMVDTLIAPCSKASYLSAYPLNGGISFSVISKAVGYNPNGEHTSGRNFKRPGWIYMSDFGAPSATSPYVGRDEIFAVKLDPTLSGDSPVVNRFAHTHHDTNMPYATMPFGVPNPDGTKVLWGSEWHKGLDAAALTYVAEAPVGGFPIATSTPTKVPTATPIPTKAPSPTPKPTGNGLNGYYFTNKTLTGKARLIRIDSFVNFNWSTRSPASSIPSNNFSVRWTGYVVPKYSQTYTFYTRSNDGVRLWVNGKRIISNWTNHASIENKGTIALTAGKKYSIKMEYYENTGSSVAGLFWSSASQPKQAIPKSQLYTK